MRGPFDVAVNGGFRFDLCSLCSSNSRSTRVFKWGFQKRRKDRPMNMIICRSNGSAFRVSVGPNVSPGKNELNNQIKMVDPLEAKQLARKEMQEFKAMEKLKRQRQIEAVNGAWAMIGLTAGLVIEGRTGNSILTQLAGYLSAIISFFTR